MLARQGGKGCIWSIQRLMKTELDPYSQTPWVDVCVDDNTSSVLMFFSPFM